MERKQPEQFGSSTKLDDAIQKSNKIDRKRAKSLPESSTVKESHGCGKRVQFADTMGLNLASVRHFDISDDGNETCTVLSGSKGCHSQHVNDFRSALNFSCLVPAFNLPISSDAVDLKSRRLGVALESITTGSNVEGLIRVMRGHSTKEVGVRYTLNNWLTFSDIQAAPRLDEEPVLQREHFHFVLQAPPCFDQDSSVHFAVYCRTDHGEYWDNNDGQNYTLKIQMP